MFESNKQIQTSGGNSQQIQIGTQIINYGISEERAREIYKELTKKACKEYSIIAYNKIDERLKTFQEYVLQKINQLEDKFSMFADPSFQFLLYKAQLTAACTDNNIDYSFLAELLVYYIQRNNNRMEHAAINRAVEIIDKIDNQALCALTVVYSINHLSPCLGDCVNGLTLLNSAFDNLIYEDLPINTNWIEHLEILNAVRILQIAKFHSLIDTYIEFFKGYTCVGIKNKSYEYEEAIKILEDAYIDTNILIENRCMPGYCILNIKDKSFLEREIFLRGDQKILLGENEKTALNKVISLYSNDKKLLEKAKNNFIKIFKSFNTLNKLSMWWNSIPYAFEITHIGKVLAYINVRRCNSQIPEANLLS